MRSVALQNLPEQGAQAALHSIDFKHDPQLLVGLLLLHPEGLALNVIRKRPANSPSELQL